MGLFGSIFGSKGGYSGDFKRMRNDALTDYRGALDFNTGDDAYRRATSGYSEGLFNNLRNLDASGYGDLRRSGFRDTTGGRGLYGLTAANLLARNAVDMRNQMQDQRMRGLGSYAQMLQGFAPSYYRQPSAGLFGGIAQGVGAYFGGGG